jgi:15-cis-phytoene synthase
LRDRDLVRLYWPTELRPAFDALMAIDDAMADVVAHSTQPALGAIKLAWWRERLEELDEGKVPAEPRMQAAAAELLTNGISGAELSGLEDGWAALLDERRDDVRMAERGERLFAIAGHLLGASDAALPAAGRIYAWGDLARRGITPFHGSAKEFGRLHKHRFPPKLRPLTAMARLMARDVWNLPELEPEGTPGRALAIFRHRLTGRV